jgi:hypothetical protein
MTTSRHLQTQKESIMHTQVTSVVLRNWKTLLRSMALLSIAMLWPASAQAAVYTFSLLGPMYSTNQNGDTIKLNGSGVFDTVSGAVEARGSYSIRDANGNVIERGSWAATQFISFESDGGLNNGEQGGEVSLIVTLTPSGGGSPHVGLPFTLTCPFEDGVFDGPGCDLAVGDFVIPAGGVMVFHLASA